MKKIKFINIILIAIIATFGIIASCGKKSATNTIPPEQEDMAAATNLDLAIANMVHYNDSAQIAKMHSSQHLHRFDSIYHHHDSLYNHHHTKYHHGDSAHHHTGYHHTATQHHQHDSISNAHHNIIH